MSKIRHHNGRLISILELKDQSSLPGRVAHDSRGNAVWDWAIETDVFSRTTTADLLKTLNEPRLALESEIDTAQGWHGDPYNRSVG